MRMNSSPPPFLMLNLPLALAPAAAAAAAHHYMDTIFQSRGCK